MTEKIALCGALTTLALIFSYIERLIPFDLGAPGIKLGLSNLVVVIALYVLGGKYAFGINILRILLSGILFNGLFSMIYASFGGILSFFIMYFLKRTNKFSIIGVSMAGGVFHNIGQIAMASLIISNIKIFYYLPVLIISGMISGIIIGIFAYYLVNPVKKIMNSRA